MANYCITFLVFMALLRVCYGQCDAYSNADDATRHRCACLYHLLEFALLNEDNLYILRDAFFSSFHPSPTTLIVKYEIPHMKLFGHDASEDQVISMGWSSSGLFTVVDPLVLALFHSGSLLSMFQAQNLQPFPNTVALTLDILNPFNLIDLKGVAGMSIDEMLNVFKGMDGVSTTELAYVITTRVSCPICSPLKVIVNTF